MGLCFVFGLETLLIVPRCFHYCRTALKQSHGPPHQWGGWVGTRSWEWTQLWQWTPTNPRDVPYHMASCSTYKAEGRKVRGGAFRLMAFCLPNHHHVWWSPAFLGRGDHLLPLGTWKWFSKSLFYFSDAIFVWFLVYLFSWLYLFHFLLPLHWQGGSCCGSLS